MKPKIFSENMNAFLSILLFIFISATLHARAEHIWSYQEMFDKADTVMVATALKREPVADFFSTEGSTEGYQVDFTVLGVFKGDKKKEISIVFCKPSKRSVPANCHGYIDIDPKENNQYLLFLKDGHPLTGDFNPLPSIRIIKPSHSTP
jgi:hypothetical protein